MIEFYRVRWPAQVLGHVVIVAEDTEAGILLGWVPNTRLWHRATELENDYLFGDEGGLYERISAAEAEALLPTVLLTRASLRRGGLRFAAHACSVPGPAAG
ncbi:hypothetical protein BKD30_13565 [Tersicoccus phoenicis]|uniref:Uncharacterized protein n=1 Tax=Tersicoccus phoenicis TaxID=554083 RepID=A0A1R1L6T6_9MICC|nr:hypothetical protein [Tersicoccus phoenicis]OMH23252.1 hypothetical protein BKD30_13565 [Tersicoccus phoenicis]